MDSYDDRQHDPACTEDAACPMVAHVTPSQLRLRRLWPSLRLFKTVKCDEHQSLYGRAAAMCVLRVSLWKAHAEAFLSPIKLLACGQVERVEWQSISDKRNRVDPTSGMSPDPGFSCDTFRKNPTETGTTVNCNWTMCSSLLLAFVMHTMGQPTYR